MTRRTSNEEQQSTLIVDFLNGDLRAGRQFVAAYDRIAHWAAKPFGYDDDLVAAAWLGIFRASQAWSSCNAASSGFRAYASSAARRAVIDEHRRFHAAPGGITGHTRGRRRKTRRPTSEEKTKAKVTTVDWDDATDGIARQSRCGNLEDAVLDEITAHGILKELPAEASEMMRMRFLEDATLEDIAGRFKCGTTKAWSSLKKAQQQARTCV